MELNIIPKALLDEYKSKVPLGLPQAFNELKEAELSTPNFSFYTSVASVFSSKIEGEQIDLDSYIKHKRDGISFQPDYTNKIDDLYGAYIFTQNHSLNEVNLKEAHRLLSKHIVANAWQGKYRTQNLYVATEDGKIEYVAAVPQIVPGEIQKLIEDINLLQEQSLTIQEAFYYAASIHLVFVKIHPCNDGNGRTGRLLEKWFLAEKLGAKAWFIESEKSYYAHHQEYYQNLRRLGLEYDLLDYNKAIPFLLMLPQTLVK